MAICIPALPSVWFQDACGDTYSSIGRQSSVCVLVCYSSIYIPTVSPYTLCEAKKKE